MLEDVGGRCCSLAAAPKSHLAESFRNGALFSKYMVSVAPLRFQVGQSLDMERTVQQGASAKAAEPRSKPRNALRHSKTP